jgi:hypothetical protein
MTYPILEFDSTPEAFIESSKIIRTHDLPDHCVICFFREVIDKIIAEYDAKVMVEIDGKMARITSTRSHTKISAWLSSIQALVRQLLRTCSKKRLLLVVGNSLPAVVAEFSKKILQLATLLWY